MAHLACHVAGPTTRPDARDATSLSTYSMVGRMAADRPGWSAVVDTTTLVSELIEDGKRIVEQLPQDGFEVTAAFWLKAVEDGQWYFYIVSPVAESERLNDAYRRLYTLIRAMPQRDWIDPLEIKLIGPSHPIARDVLAIYNRSAGPKKCPIHWGGNVLGNVNVEGAYLYPLGATASS
jgi:hypothetical protein